MTEGRSLCNTFLWKNSKFSLNIIFLTYILRMLDILQLKHLFIHITDLMVIIL